MKTPPQKLKVDDVELDLGTLEVFCRGKPIDLTAVEFKLLEVLLRSVGLVLSREALTEAVLGRTLSPYDRSIDVHISKLRRKLGNKTSGVERIRSVRNGGYLYVLSSSESETDRT